nr:MAG TPA_asm: hypothetical protein [Caudoviricetes sp.]
MRGFEIPRILYQKGKTGVLKRGFCLVCACKLLFCGFMIQGI